MALRLIVAGAIGLLGVLVGPGRASAQCDIDIDGTIEDIEQADTPDDAIEIGEGATVTVIRPGDGLLLVVVWTGPVPIPVPVTWGGAGETGTVDLDDVDWLGVGLYRVDVFGPGAGECAGTSWFRVTGRSPLTTVAGISATAFAVAGIALVAQSARRGRRQRCSIWRGAIGGLLAGVAGSFLLQQFAVLPMLVPIIAVALLVPTVVGALVARACCGHAPLVRLVTPVLVAPVVVGAGERFELRAGVTATVPPRRRRRDPATEVTVQLVAGAATVEAGSWRRTVVVDDRSSEVVIAVQMRATRDVGESSLTAFYSSGGQTIGMARRPLWVVEPGGLPPPVAGQAVGTVANRFALPVAQRPVDLELRATFAGPQALNILQWTAESPHRARLTIPDAPVTIDLGGEPELFAATLLADVTEGEGRPGLAELLLGTGRQLARTIDASMMDVLRDVVGVAGPAPRVLLLTEESSIPWELTAVEPAPPGRPPFLATRAIVGRWILAPGAPLPPPVTVSGGTRHVVATDDLPAAGSESRRLQAEFGFRPGAPTMAGVLDTFERADVVHLACHGSWRIDQGRSFLQLADGRLVPRHIAGLRLERHPFVFLNACQVAAGGDALGTPTGFPAELVFAGASGCVTPLWSVRDDQAYEIAVAFYRQLLAGGPPAELIHELRTRAAEQNLTSSTPFAYQYWGHPDLRVTEAAPAARSA